MIHNLLKVRHFIPDDHVNTIYDININYLKSEGKTILLFDIDNTIIPYDIDLPDDKIQSYFDNLKNAGFQIVLISNNHKSRIKPFSEALGLPYVFSAKKPLKSGFKKALKRLDEKPNKQSITLVGDQLMTDVFGGKRFGIDVVLVKPIKQKTEKWYTKINRIVERKMLKRIQKRFPETYDTLNLHTR